TAKPSRRKPKSRSGSNNPSSGSTGSNNPGPRRPAKPVDKAPNKPGPSTPPSTPVNARRIGLGVTLFMRDSNGLAVRVDPNHVFRKGDRVRVLVDTHHDRYLNT